jgi:peptidoglycan/xylan/chitin deacetylase (PgdA/CDA1 family)
MARKMHYGPHTLKNYAYTAARSLGLFAAARFLTRKKLRILCYHGFELDDETHFRPALFVKPETFRERVEYLRRKNYEVLSLQSACKFLERDQLPNSPVVITIDDGFYGTYKFAGPVLSEYHCPATIYVTTYYCLKQTPVFRLAVQYMFWKAPEGLLNLSGLEIPKGGPMPPEWPNSEKNKQMWDLIQYGENECDEAGRQALARKLAAVTGVDYEELVQNRALSLMTAEEIRAMAAAGVDIQLQTHRHRLPLERQLAHVEITDNREFLGPLSRKTLDHLCYPSGQWSVEHWPWLKEMGIKSATTCEVGFNDSKTPIYGLRRFLDGENVSAIEFEAEVSGFAEILRRIQAALHGKQWVQAEYSAPNGTVHS